MVQHYKKHLMPFLSTGLKTGSVPLPVDCNKKWQLLNNKGLIVDDVNFQLCEVSWDNQELILPIVKYDKVIAAGITLRNDYKYSVPVKAMVNGKPRDVYMVYITNEIKAEDFRNVIILSQRSEDDEKEA